MRATARRVFYNVLRGTGLLDLRNARRASTGRGWATILVFHRVSNDVPDDNLTVTEDRFRHILELLERRYATLALTELLERVEEGGTLTGREVVITFDDGYRDNFENAAPLLREFSMPACFYLTAGYIGTDKSFPWDVAGGIHSNIMSWSEANALSEMGFEIGCHTWSHPDLGVEPLSSAPKELVDAKQTLSDKLGVAIDHFAYPFGGPRNITENWLSAIREAGFRSCVSAHGGEVTANADPLSLPRLNASYQPRMTDLSIDLDHPWS